MWDRIRRGFSLARRQSSRANFPAGKRARRLPLMESLEGRQLMAASLAPISNLTVPAQQGYQQILDGSQGTNPPLTQTYTAKSDNPKIAVKLAQGPYWTVTVSHQPAPSGTDVTIDHESMTFQLFQDLTPNTVSRITTLTDDNYYTNGFPNNNPPSPPGQYFARILKTFVAQGGSSSPTSTASSSGLLPTIGIEPVQQLTYSGDAQLAMARTSDPNSNDAQFFITYGQQTSLNYNYTLFGQLVAGKETLAKLANVQVTSNGSGENSQPVSPVTINSVVFGQNTPNAVLHIDSTSARQGETANITVTATDPTDGTTKTEQFKVTVGAYGGPQNPSLNFVPFANPVTQSTTINTQTSVQLSGESGYPGTPASPAPVLSYVLVSQPSNGTISQFNPFTGTLVYTPKAGFLGSDSFQYTVSSSTTTLTPGTATSIPGTVTIKIGSGQTNTVRLIGRVLVVTPLPRTDGGTNIIQVTEQTDTLVTGGKKIVVTVNGIPDAIQPAPSALDQLIVFGAKASDRITVDDSVTVPAVLDGGHGGKNVVRGGGGVTTIEHGWFGHTVLIGGKGRNRLIGRAGSVRFKPSSATVQIFAGVPKPRNHKNEPVQPGGTYYRFKNGHLIPVFTIK